MPCQAVHPLRKRCLDLAGEEPLMFADGYDAALLGIAWREGIAIVAYDRQGVIDILCQRDGMATEDAEEFFGYNVQGAWLGEATPIFVECASVGDGA
jgi:hypothetical protein